MKTREARKAEECESGGKADPGIVLKLPESEPRFRVDVWKPS